MKIIMGVIFALVSAIIMTALNYNVFNKAIPDFFIGWVSCTMNFEGHNFYNYLKRPKDQNEI